MALEASTDHATRALARLLEQFKGKPNIAALLTAYVNRTQELEDGLQSLLTVNLDAATGESLDLLGRIVGETRKGWDDDTYRIRLRARIKLNLSSGTVNEILELLVLVLGDGYTFILTPKGKASFTLDVQGELDAATAAEAAAVLRLARAAGVNAHFQYGDHDPEDSFTFAEGDAATADAARGFSDDAGLTGGLWVGVIAS